MYQCYVMQLHGGYLGSSQSSGNQAQFMTLTTTNIPPGDSILWLHL